MKNNKLTVKGLMKRLEDREAAGAELVPVEKFAKFMQTKIDKKREMEELTKFSHLIDIDKDGNIGEEDLLTCLNNIPTLSFF